MNNWIDIDEIKEERDEFDVAVGSLIALLNFVRANNTAIGVESIFDLRHDVASAMSFNFSMTSPDERADAVALIKGNNDVFETIRILKRNRKERKAQNKKK
jgi:hypothetical protein